MPCRPRDCPSCPSLLSTSMQMILSCTFGSFPYPLCPIPRLLSLVRPAGTFLGCKARDTPCCPRAAEPAEFLSFPACAPFQLPIPSSFSSLPGTAGICVKPHTVTQTPRKQASVGIHRAPQPSQRMKAAGIFLCLGCKGLPVWGA